LALILSVVADRSDGGLTNGRAATPIPENDQQVRPGTRPDLLVLLVVGTGVDPVTFRFSGGRSAN
jgi:hypothetical protein